MNIFHAIPTHPPTLPVNVVFVLEQSDAQIYLSFTTKQRFISEDHGWST